MSTADREDDAADEGARTDPKAPLSQRETFELYLRDLALRPYLLGALGGLAMTCLVMLMGGSDVGALVVGLFGTAALAFRWVVAPPFLLIILLYFSVFPTGIPWAGSENPFEVKETQFRVADAILVMSVLVYLRCFYRTLSVVHQAMPHESVFRRKGDHPVRRPTAHIAPDEIGWLVMGAAGLVVAGEAAWWLVNALDFVPTEGGVPLRWADTASFARYRRGERPPGEFTPGQHRFFVMIGGLFGALLVGRLVFGYWRLRMMTAAEAAMVLADTSWAESHRERVRVEKWRVWGREKAAEKEREAAQAERAARERRQREEAGRARAAARARERAAGADDRPRRTR